MRMTWMLLLGVAAVLGCGDGDHEADENLSRGLVSFRYSLSSGLGFCPGEGSVYRAEIRSEGDGTLTIAGSVVDAGVVGQDACLPQGLGSCWVERPIVRHILSERERDQLAATFEDVRIVTHDEPDCGSADPCVVKRFAWTNQAAAGEATVAASSGSCAPRLSDDAAEAVTMVVTSVLLGSP